MGILANHPFYHFWQTIVFVIFAGGPVLILVPGPGLALNGPAYFPLKIPVKSKKRSFLEPGWDSV